MADTIIQFNLPDGIEPILLRPAKDAILVLRHPIPKNPEEERLQMQTAEYLSGYFGNRVVLLPQGYDLGELPSGVFVYPDQPPENMDAMLKELSSRGGPIMAFPRPDPTPEQKHWQERISTMAMKEAERQMMLREQAAREILFPGVSKEEIDQRIATWQAYLEAERKAILEPEANRA